MQDQDPTSGIDVPSQLCVISTAPDTKIFQDQKKRRKSQHSQRSVYHFPLANCSHTLIVSTEASYLFFPLCLVTFIIICDSKHHSLCF